MNGKMFAGFIFLIVLGKLCTKLELKMSQSIYRPTGCPDDPRPVYEITKVLFSYRRDISLAVSFSLV